MPKVSVIIPLYNGERFIRNAIESVLCQTVQDFELIVVDDGSTDRSKDIVLGIKGPITYVYQENSGVAAARNHGFLISQGEYIAFLDQDDRWYPQKLEIQVKHLDQNPEVGIAYCDVNLIDETSNVVEFEFLKKQRQLPKEKKFLSTFPYFPQPHPYPSTVLMCREVFSQSGMFDPAFKRNCHEDTELWFRVLKKNLGQFFFHPEPLAERRCHALQGGKDEEAWHENWILCLKKLLVLYADDPKIEVALRRRLARTFSHTGKNWMKEGMVEQGRAYFKKSFGYYPFYWKNIARLIRSYLIVG